MLPVPVIPRPRDLYDLMIKRGSYRVPDSRIQLEYLQLPGFVMSGSQRCGVVKINDLIEDPVPCPRLPSGYRESPSPVLPSAIC